MLNLKLGGSLVALALFIIPAATAQAATTEIGSVAAIDANLAPNPSTTGGSVVQVSSAAGRSYTVPNGYGVITRLRHRTGTNSGNLTFKVYRPTGNAAEYTLVADETHAVAAGATVSFDTRIPVQPGDTLGLSSPSGPSSPQEAYAGTPADGVGFFPSEPTTTTPSTASPNPNYYLDVAARVETDADGDGYGDDTQDGCPTDPADHTACAADTEIGQSPKNKVKTKKKKAKVKYTFTSPQADVTFQCSVDDGAFKACTSPFKKKFTKGPHDFAVQAVNASGEPDGTPATDSFKVKVKKKKK